MTPSLKHDKGDYNKNMKLYHFTSHLHLPYVLSEGINRGDIPHNEFESVQGVWLTTEKSKDKQFWNKGKVIDKAAVRLKVDINPSDEKLIHWPDYAARIQIDSNFYLAHARYNEFSVGDWYVYLGQIDTDRIVDTVILKKAHSFSKSFVADFDRYVIQGLEGLTGRNLVEQHLTNSF